MKTVTQKDFRDLYPAPDTEKTEEMHRTLAVLPDRKEKARESREPRPVFRKRRVAFILAAALMLIGITALAVGLLNGTAVSWGGTPRPFSEEELHLPPQAEMDPVTRGADLFPVPLIPAPGTAACPQRCGRRRRRLPPGYGCRRRSRWGKTDRCPV